MEERQSRLSSMVWRRLRPYFCVRLILLNSMFSNFCHVLKIGKKRGRKQKIQRSILQSVVFQWYKIQYFFTGTNYLRLKLFVIRTFILFLKIKMYACRTFWLSCFFIKDVDNAAYTVGKTFQRGKRPVLLWQSRLKKMSSASGYERNGV